MPKAHSRREFLVSSAVTAGALALGCTARGTATTPAPARGGVVLFQGDSITDAGRTRTDTAPNVPRALGTGYPLLVASAILRADPDARWQVYNRGVSGNKVPDLAARWDADTVALKPDVLSILIGVNDYWHTKRGGYTGTVADYETQYAALLARTRSALPRARIIVLEPFVTRVGAVDESWFPQFDERRAAAARVANAAGATWVPLQSAFDDVSARSGPAYWATDGVHPTVAGHALIAERWRAATGL
jgi:lysophospholipase L1-like esterase